MKISIVITVYNGMQYLEEQLDSIFSQSRKADEIIIINDASVDGSSEILQAYTQKYNNIKLTELFDNQGVVKSFEQGIQQATGDIIFLCDQDDKWKPHKIERFIEVFQETDALLCFSDADLIDEFGEELGQTFMDKLGLDIQRKLMITEGKADLALTKRNIVSGAMMAFKREILSNNIFPFIYGEKHMLHDRFIASVIAAQFPDRIYFIDEPLSYYRIHENQVMGFNEKESESITRHDYFTNETKLIEYILERAENTHFRRAHYFWFMRSSLHKLPFLRRFITANTLLLEGDYKRFTTNPYKEMIKDVMG